jgi:hypothetical protein
VALSSPENASELKEAATIAETMETATTDVSFPPLNNTARLLIAFLSFFIQDSQYLTIAHIRKTTTPFDDKKNKH